MPFGTIAAATISAAGAIGGAVISSNASSKAAKTVQQGADTATAEQRREYDQSRADLQPWLSTGTAALGRLASLYGLSGGPATMPASSVGGGAGGGDMPAAPGLTPSGTTGTAPSFDPNATFYQSPDYQFRLTQGLRGVDAGNAARGSLDSGATRKAEIGYAGNLASGEFNNYANRLAALAGVGQTAANTNASMGAAYATNVGNIAMNAADNRASSYLANGQGYANSISQLAGIGSGLITNLYSKPYSPEPVTVTPSVYGTY